MYKESQNNVIFMYMLGVWAYMLMYYFVLTQA